MSQSLRLSSSLLARISRTSASAIPRRAFTISAIRKADLVQDIYLRELRNYKIPQPKPNEAEGHVQKFAPPSPPKSPEEANLASSVSEYEAQTVEIEGQAATGEQAEPEEDYFEDMEEKEEQAHGHGH